MLKNLWMLHMHISRRMLIPSVPAPLICSLKTRNTSYKLLTKPLPPSRISKSKISSLQLHPPIISLLAWNTKNPLLDPNTTIYLTLHRIDYLTQVLPVHQLQPIILCPHALQPLSWTSMSKIKKKTQRQWYFSVTGSSLLNLILIYAQKLDMSSQRLSPILNLTPSKLVIGIPFKANSARLLESPTPLFLFKTNLKCNYV